MKKVTALMAATLLATAGCGRGGEQPSAAGARPIDAGIVPPTMVGMNLAPPASGDPAPSFANLVQAHGDYWLVQNTGNQYHSPTIKLDAGGHPIDVPADTEISVSLVPDPHSDVRSIACTGSPGWSASTHDGSNFGGARSFRFSLSKMPDGIVSGGSLELRATVSRASLPHLDCRDTRLPAGALFDPALFESIRPFRVVRFMDWMQTNNAPHREWRDRPLPDDFYYAFRGVPVEHMVALANEAHVDPWFTLPWDTSPEYYRAFAEYVRAHLAADRTVYVELSNEVWNDGFQQSRDAAALGKSLYPGEEAGRATDFAYADRVRALMAIWSEAFRGQEKRLVRVASSIAVLPDRADNILGHRQTWRSVDMLATAPYFGTDGFEVKTDDAKTRIDTLFANGPATVEQWIRLSKQAKAVAARYGLRYGTYEGGPGYLNGMPAMQEQLSRMARDPRMYTLYSLFLERWRKEVGGLFMAFNSIGGFGQYGAWGHKEYPSQPLSEAPKMRALVDFAAKLPAPR